MARNHDREAIGARLRFEVLRRCNFACYYCGVQAALGVKQLHIDHVIPVALGGTNDPWNLVAACWDCNAGKTNTCPSEELIRQVREDWALTRRPDGVVQCEDCGIPIHVQDGDSSDRDCTTCATTRADERELVLDAARQLVLAGKLILRRADGA